jgi:tetratricopeptide (TPR) repeat protein
VQRFEEAIAAHQEAAAIFREAGDRRGEGWTLDNLGSVHYKMRRPAQAAAYWRDAAAAMGIRQQAARPRSWAPGDPIAGQRANDPGFRQPQRDVPRRLSRANLR